MKSVALLLVIALSACEHNRTPVLEIATTTSVVNSGLLETLLPRFTGATVRVHAAGSGRSLAMLADGEVPLIITHAPETEARYLAQHSDWRYRKIAWNRFVIVGPKADPANVSQAASAVDAFQRIAKAKAVFVSRGDESGTHEREQELWKGAGVTAPEVLTSGGSMAMALRHANDRNGYTLSDEATWWQFEPRSALTVLFAADAALMNTYAVITRPDDRVAIAFADWLSDGDGCPLIAAYQIAGRPAFTLWPVGCRADMPSALPCL
jgi:tungstate transport system substrate-binding protein